MSKRMYWRRGSCRLCGANAAPAVDNFGQPYMGCSRCVVVEPSPKQVEAGQRGAEFDPLAPEPKEAGRE